MPAFEDPAKKHGLPDKTYTDKMTVLGGNEAIDLYHFGPAHTNGDTFVVFRNLRVMHAGDAFPAQGTPFIDLNNGGNGVAYPETLAKAAAGIKDVDTVIPGHSAVTTWAAFVEYGEFMKALVDGGAEAKKAGKTAEQGAAELKLPEKFKDYAIDAARRTTSPRSMPTFRSWRHGMLTSRREQRLEVGALADRGEDRLALDGPRQEARRDRGEPRDRRLGVALLHARPRGRQAEVARPQPFPLQALELGAGGGELRCAEQRFAVGQAQPGVVGAGRDQTRIDAGRGRELAGRDVRGGGGFRNAAAERRLIGGRRAAGDEVERAVDHVAGRRLRRRTSRRRGGRPDS